MRGGYELEQVFLYLRGAMTEVLLVTVAPSGALRRETFKYHTRDLLEASRRAAKHLAQRGDVDDVTDMRLRIEKNDSLQDDPKLKHYFQDIFWEHY